MLTTHHINSRYHFKLNQNPKDPFIVNSLPRRPSPVRYILNKPLRGCLWLTCPMLLARWRPYWLAHRRRRGALTHSPGNRSHTRGPACTARTACKPNTLALMSLNTINCTATVAHQVTHSFTSNKRLFGSRALSCSPSLKYALIRLCYFTRQACHKKPPPTAL